MQRTAVGVVVLASVVSGCGGGGGGGAAGATGNVCVPGMSVACACTNGSQGAQTCTPDGDGYGACTCSSGMAGTTGSAGTTGTGGAVGTAGTVGSAGTTGAAGSVATAGTTGTAGAGGRGGTGGASAGAAGRGGGGGATGSAGTMGTGGATGTGGTGGYTGRLVSVIITDSIIAPGMADDSEWDGIGYVDPAVKQAVAVALVGANPAASVLAALATPALANIDKPDPYGDAYATAFGIPGPRGELASMDYPVPNTFHPTWQTQWAFVNLPIDSDVRITVELWDADLLDNDPIETVVLNSTDLKAALASQQAFEVQVDDQGQHQLLFVGIVVTQQAGPL